MIRGALMALALAAGGWVGSAQAEPATISAPQAFDAATTRHIILLEIRSPEEWRESGVAQGALTVTMNDVGFASTLRTILARNPDTPVALICATGGRSQYVASVLERNGISGVIDVSEGMFGNEAAPGWLARDMPVVDAQTALTATQVFLKQ
ncbi:rhodanese-like domain-containing protein [Sulfitobacter sp.]|uniref:rhodanese-like domain-containing protein n=1 Tax=Sulfitobacter sp. TaxID=1903071 RepID=UPI003001D594